MSPDLRDATRRLRDAHSARRCVPGPPINARQLSYATPRLASDGRESRVVSGAFARAAADRVLRLGGDSSRSRDSDRTYADSDFFNAHSDFSKADSDFFKDDSALPARLFAPQTFFRASRTSGWTSMSLHCTWSRRPYRIYSSRNASVGSTRVARNAGR